MSNTAAIIDDVNVLVQEGLYKDQKTLLQDALRALLRSKPELRHQMALGRYKQGDISLTRAAEIAGVDQESFKDLLRETGIPSRVNPIDQETLQQEVEQLLQLRKRTQ